MQNGVLPFGVVSNATVKAQSGGVDSNRSPANNFCTPSIKKKTPGKAVAENTSAQGRDDHRC